MLPPLPWAQDVAKLSEYLGYAERLAVWATVVTLVGAIATATGTVSRIKLSRLREAAIARRDGPRHVPRESSARAGYVGHLASGAGVPVSVAGLAGSPEAERFAGEIAQLLRDAHWAVEGPGKLVTTSLPPANAVLRCSAKVEPSAVAALRECLEHLNSPTTVELTDADATRCELWLGLHP